MVSVNSEMEVFPAYAGMIRVPSRFRDAWDSVPRLRGDDPVRKTLYLYHSVCSPPTRG